MIRGAPFFGVKWHAMPNVFSLVQIPLGMVCRAPPFLYMPRMVMVDPCLTLLFMPGLTRMSPDCFSFLCVFACRVLNALRYVSACHARTNCDCARYKRPWALGRRCSNSWTGSLRLLARPRPSR